MHVSVPIFISSPQVYKLSMSQGCSQDYGRDGLNTPHCSGGATGPVGPVLTGSLLRIPNL